MINKSISLVLPAFNEEKNLAHNVGIYDEFLRQNFRDYEILVVDDGSQDKTYDVCLGFANKLGARFRVIKHPQNKGYGAALRSGLFSANKELVFYTDADNQFDITQLCEFVNALEGFDMVIGYRAKRQDSFMRLFTSKVYNFLIFMLFGLKVRDIDCSYKLFRRDALARLSIDRDEFFVDTELLVKAKNLKLKIKELPVRHHARLYGTSTVKLSHIFSTLKDIFYLYHGLKK